MRTKGGAEVDESPLSPSNSALRDLCQLQGVGLRVLT